MKKSFAEPRLIGLGLLIALLLGLSAAWQWSPLREYLTPERLIDTLRGMGDAIGPWGAVVALALALTVAVPLGLLILVSQLALGPWVGSACVLAGALLSALASQMIGRQLGHAVLLRMAGPKIVKVSESLERRGLVAVIALRLVPALPFAIVNMIAGSTHLRRRDMLLGSALGMLPGIVLIAVFTDRILDALQNPGPERYLLIGLIAALVIVGSWALKRWLGAQAR
ncbi:VTT domain-containing protein [Paucibacter sp. R3-3]|uniref:TVP38/TMEM64 family membrane protein n=1 Tax=Roseateles agri TaxID=3098619 RepID=A0ABU5DF08_9BURK|nr:VTT domain-containing protein [Paucibacter sp. R3-3]MDY0743757.1 VTT domain-containing protein [Paucibacter sp. R3-3]